MAGSTQWKQQNAYTIVSQRDLLPLERCYSYLWRPIEYGAVSLRHGGLRTTSYGDCKHSTQSVSTRHWSRLQRSDIALSYTLRGSCEPCHAFSLAWLISCFLWLYRTGLYVVFVILVGVAWYFHEYRSRSIALFHHYYPLRWLRTHFLESSLVNLRHHVPIPIFRLSKFTIQAPLRYQAVIITGIVCINVIPLLCSYHILPGSRDVL